MDTRERTRARPALVKTSIIESRAHANDDDDDDNDSTRNVDSIHATDDDATASELLSI